MYSLILTAGLVSAPATPDLHLARSGCHGAAAMTTRAGCHGSVMARSRVVTRTRAVGPVAAVPAVAAIPAAPAPLVVVKPTGPVAGAPVPMAGPGPVTRPGLGFFTGERFRFHLRSGPVMSACGPNGCPGR